MFTGLVINRVMGDARQIDLIVNDEIKDSKSAGDGRITVGCGGTCEGMKSFCCSFAEEHLPLTESMAWTIFNALDYNLNVGD
jgi:hypothetical protein